MVDNAYKYNVKRTEELLGNANKIRQDAKILLKNRKLIGANIMIPNM